MQRQIKDHTNNGRKPDQIWWGYVERYRRNLMLNKTIWRIVANEDCAYRDIPGRWYPINSLSALDALVLSIERVQEVTKTLLPQWRWGLLSSKWSLRCTINCQMRRRLCWGTGFGGRQLSVRIHKLHRMVSSGHELRYTDIVGQRVWIGLKIWPGLHLPSELWVLKTQIG